MLSDNFKADYYRMTGTHWNWKGYIRIHLHHNLRYMYWYRKYQAKPGVYRRFQLYRLSRKYGLEISPGAEIGVGLYLGHPYNITVAEGVSIGNNVNLSKGCTIGRENRGQHTGVPSIGNCVYVGINSTVVGRIKIGDDVLISPNAFVNFDVPSHSVVIGNPGVIHSRKDATRDYINFML